MGGCASAVAGRRRSEAIDRQLKEDHKKYKRESRILLLGSDESGKSTIVKQMKIHHQNGFSPEELDTFRPIIYQNLLDSAQAIVIHMRKIDQQCEQQDNRMLAEKILDYQLEAPSSKELYFSQEIAYAIHQFHKDAAVQKIIDDYISEFYLMDSAQYFFEHVLRIGTPNYRPNETDILRAQVKTFGITETRFSMGKLSIRMFDFGRPRPGPQKWFHCFLETMTSIIFCIALSEYDQLLGDKSQNRMTESLNLFESVINSRWFLRTSIILFLNKIDVFKDKLQKVPLEHHFPEYTGGKDVDKAAKYILWRFLKLNRAKLSVYPHLTQASDPTNIRLVFAAVKETILQNTIKDSDIL